MLPRNQVSQWGPHLDDLQGRQPHQLCLFGQQSFLKPELECLWEDSLGDPMPLCPISCATAKMDIIHLVSTVRIQGIEY